MKEMNLKERKKFNTELFEKILDFIEYFYPGIYELSRDKYFDENSAMFKVIKNKQNFDEDYNAWFLTKLTLPNGTNVVKMAYCFPEDYFTQSEKQMLRNLMNYHESVFGIIDISKDNKIYKIKDFKDNKVHKIRTFDLPVKYKAGDVITALIVKDIEENYFFLGAICSYNLKNIENVISMLLLKFELDELEKEKREKLKIDWDIVRK